MITRQLDIEAYNTALRMLQEMEGAVSFIKILPVIQQFQSALLPEMGGEECPSPTQPKSLSTKSEPEA